MRHGDERSRHRKAKVPIGSISAGGVDMARGHTTNIKPAVDYDRRVSAPPKVVVNAETDPRKVPTHRGTHRGRDMREGAPRDAMLPDDPEMVAFPRKWSSRPPPMDDPPIVDAPILEAPDDPSERPTVVMSRHRRWVLLGAAVALMVLVAGVTKRVWTHTDSSTMGGPEGGPPKPPRAAIADDATTAAPEPAPTPALIESAKPPSAPAPPATSAPARAAVPSAAAPQTASPAAAPAPAPKPTFVPPFQLPEERKPQR